MHPLLLRFGPELLVVLAVALIVAGVALDRDWITGIGVVEPY
jgi:hypothetical protein